MFFSHLLTISKVAISSAQAISVAAGCIIISFLQLPPHPRFEDPYGGAGVPAIVCFQNLQLQFSERLRFLARDLENSMSRQETFFSKQSY